MVKSIAVVGAGFTGSVISYHLAKAGYHVDIFDSRSHVAGNCFTERDPETGIMIHSYGPHIFHTSNDRVWNFIRQFDEFMPFTNRVKALTGGRMYSLPINLLTINQFFGKVFTPSEAEKFFASIGDTSIEEPKTFEQQALRFVGRELYDAFFREYTIKQWGTEPANLPASILKRLPIRFNYDDNYYSSRYQGMPRHGYTEIIRKLLNHSHIRLKLNTFVDRNAVGEYEHVFYSGPIDEWFNYSLGRLGYRTLDFVVERYRGDYQGNAVINYCDMTAPWTRISEHKHFCPWESHDETVIFKEYSRGCEPTDTPYYPIRLVEEKIMLARYIEMARSEVHTTFVGRLGTYRYLDMHVAIGEALEVVEKFLECRRSKEPMPAFVVNPL